MKKIFFLLILFLFSKVYSKTYTLNLHVYVTNGSSSVDSNTAGRVHTFANSNTNRRNDYPILSTVKETSYYTIKYQAFQGTAARKIITTPSNFIYTHPAPLTYELSGNNPVCNNGSDSITITAHNGSEEYYYSINGIIKIPLTNKTSVTTSIVNGKTVETHLGIQQIELPASSTTVHNITVTNCNACIEKYIKL